MEGDRSFLIAESVVTLLEIYNHFPNEQGMLAILIHRNFLPFKVLYILQRFELCMGMSTQH